MKISTANPIKVRAAALLELRRRQHGNRPPQYQYAGKPEAFIREVLGVKILTEDQVKILDHFVAEKVINVQAAHGVGKTFLVAAIVLYWVYAEGGLAITTAPTGRQVRELLWSEVRRLYAENQSKLGGTCDIMQLRYSEDARAYGFAARSSSSSGFQGIHHSKLLAIQDEASGITNEIDEGFESCITGAHNKGIRVGNPIDPATAFAEHCQEGHIRIPVWNHPNVAWAYQRDADGVHRLKSNVAAAILDNKGRVLPINKWTKYKNREVVAGAVSVDWIERQRRRYGEQSAFWTSRVEGMFPQDSKDALVPRSWFLAARARYDENPQYWEQAANGHQFVHGLDVGDGGDPHAIASRCGPVLYYLREYPTVGDRQDVSRAATYGSEVLDALGGRIHVDNVGVGAGSLANLLDEGKAATGVKFGDSASEEGKGQFLNTRAEVFWAVREAFRLGEIAIAPLGEEIEDALMEELAAIRYLETPRSQIKIEPKEQIKKRLGRSTNLADALALTYAQVEFIDIELPFDVG